ncbi:MAG: hypothetical protein QM635_08585, partial [Microbacteriaceae bacterium]
MNGGQGERPADRERPAYGELATPEEQAAARGVPLSELLGPAAAPASQSPASQSPASQSPASRPSAAAPPTGQPA